MAAACAVYGCHKVSLLREQAFEARKLGQYQLKERLGGGGMGEVYLAEHVLLRRPCAVKLIRAEQAGGRRVAVTGGGASAAALVQAVELGKQLLVTRGSLTAFSIASGLAECLAIIPALSGATYPALARLDVLRLASPRSAVLSALIFNALAIVALLPLALRGVRLRPAPAAAQLRRNLLVYGLGGLVLPFAGIKLIDLAINLLRLV
jgi:high-affinity K+ transport system ATPase subunit B